MKSDNFFLVFALLLATINSHQCQTNPNQIFEKCSSAEITDADRILRTLNGQIKGECYNVPVSFSNSSNISYEIFSWLAIPFAEPPLAEKRFLKPEPIRSWSTVKDGTSWPNSCIQFSNELVTSEDCLYLNVFTRRKAYLNRERELKPIMVWIHGGGFTEGGSALYEASNLVAAGDVIIVSINYRLGLFGFMFIDGIAGNAALYDQQLALKWIYDNAPKFGGDKDRITIFGESAGAWSVGFNLFMETSWPYFTNAILQSGGPTGPSNPNRLITPNIATQLRKQSTDKECNQTTDVEVLQCLQALNASTVLALTNVTVSIVQDGVLFTDSIDQLLLAGKHKKCDIITGFNANEYGLFHALAGLQKNITYTVFNNILSSWLSTFSIDYDNLFFEYLGTNKLENASIDLYSALNSMLSDSTFKCQAFGLAEGFTINNQKAFVFEYEFRNLIDPLTDLDYAVHGDELKYVFALPLSTKGPQYPKEDKLFSEQIITYWTNFAKYNDPNFVSGALAEISLWSPFARQSDNLDELTAVEKMEVGRYIWFLNEKTRMVSGFSDYRCDYWNYTRDSVYNSSPTGKANVGSWMMISILTCFFY